jgi:hypothetical protein
MKEFEENGSSENSQILEDTLRLLEMIRNQKDLLFFFNLGPLCNT